MGKRPGCGGCGAALIFAICGTLPGASLALDCFVTSVHDGDTLTATCESTKTRVRLTEIDAPERTQPYSRRSTDSLKGMCLNQPARVDVAGVDKYGRTLGRVHCNGIDANAEQVRRGYAWAFDRYLTDPQIKRIEADAREARRGLWRSADPVPPWRFRHPNAD